MNTWMRVSVWTCDFLPLSKHLGVELLGHRESVRLPFEGPLKLFFYMVLQFYILPSSVGEVQLQQILTVPWYCQVQWCFIVILICMSLMTEVEHLFTLLTAICIFSFVTCVCKLFCQFIYYVTFLLRRNVGVTEKL